VIWPRCACRKRQGRDARGLRECKSRGARGFGLTVCGASRPTRSMGQAAPIGLAQPANAGPITMIAKTMKSTSKPNLVSSDIAKLQDRRGADMRLPARLGCCDRLHAGEGPDAYTDAFPSDSLEQASAHPAARCDVAGGDARQPRVRAHREQRGESAGWPPGGSGLSDKRLRPRSRRATEQREQRHVTTVVHRTANPGSCADCLWPCRPCCTELSTDYDR
jgi:hypothetical protein